MSDYIEHKCDRCGSYTCRGYTCQEAEILRLSDEVARLEAENRRLRHCPWHGEPNGETTPCCVRAALEGDDND